MTGRTSKTPPGVLGWREWAGLPSLGVDAIKVKLDTGARTSSLHAFALTRFRRDGADMVGFQIHPRQRSADDAIHVEAEVIDERWVRNSGGQRELRPVIETVVRIGEDQWPIELTLSRRDEMGFRMLLGRQALRGRALVDPGRSYRAGKLPGQRDRKRRRDTTNSNPVPPHASEDDA
jgi:hypothetical protein